MGGFLALIGFVGFIVSLIWLVIKFIKRKPKKKIVISLITTFVLFIIGVALVPSSITEADKVLLKKAYVDLDEEEIVRLNELEEEYDGLSEEQQKEIKKDIDMLNTEEEKYLAKIEEEKAKKEAEEKAKAEQEAKKQAEKEAEEKAKAKEQAKKEAEEKAKKEAEEKAKAEAEAKKKAEAEAKKYDTGITYEELARTPDEYVGEYVKFSGRVIQVMEGGEETNLRIAVNDNYDKVIIVGYDPNITSVRVLEDDMVTIKGSSIGLYTYESALGGNITIPGILVSEININ